MAEDAARSEQPQLYETTLNDVSDEDSRLLAALHENWQHSRHIEDQRARLTAAYWLVWAGVLLFVGSSAIPKVTDGFGIERPSPFFLAAVFILVALVSAVATNAMLKWSGEYANCMSAVAAIATKLHLNVPTAGISGSQSRQSDQRHIPYPEFTGVMALPLRASVWRSVGPTFVMMTIIGLSIAVALATVNVLDGLEVNGVVSLGMGLRTLVAVLAGVAAFLLGIAIARSAMLVYADGVRARTPSLPKAEPDEGRTEDEPSS